MYVKKLLSKSTMMLMLTIISASMMFSCTEEAPVPSGQEIGYVSFALDAFEVEKLGNASGRVANFAPGLDLADFGLTIYQKGTNNVIRAFPVGSIPTDSVPLMDGEYTAVMDNHMDSSITVGHYSGSQDFTVLPQQQSTVDVTVTLQEVYFTFTLLENFYVTHSIAVSNDAGAVVTADASTPYEELYLPTLTSPDSYLFSVINNTSGQTIGTSQIPATTNGEGYNLRVISLAGSAAFGVTIDPINVQDEDFTLSPTEIIGFTGDFTGSNWASTNNGSATSYAFSESTLAFDCPGGGGGFVSQITIPADGTISFDWTMTVRTAGQYGDRFSYSINGVRVDLSNNGGSGTASDIVVSEGDVFAFLPWGTTQSSSYYGAIENFVFTY